jgi:hypothetical protein
MNGEHLIPVHDAINTAALALSVISPGKTVDIPGTGPKLQILGDDLHIARGPKAFPRKTLRAVLGKAERVMIHAAAPSAQHYAAAVETATRGLRTVIIETQPSHEQEWLSYVLRKVPKAGVLIISPNAARYGGVAGTA